VLDIDLKKDKKDSKDSKDKKDEAEEKDGDEAQDLPPGLTDQPQRVLEARPWRRRRVRRSASPKPRC